MKQFSSREIFGANLILCTGIVGFFSWNIFFRAISLPDLPHVTVAIFWFSLLAALFFVGAIVWRQWLLQIAGVFSLIAPSLFFVHTWMHIALVAASILAILLGARAIQSEIYDRVHFRFFRMIRSGSVSFIFGLSLALSSAYFASIERESWEELVPRFNLGEGTASVVFKAVAYLYPSWKNLADEGMTVDGFLLSLPREGMVTNIPAPSVTIVTNGQESPTELAAYLKQELAMQMATLGQAPGEEVLLQTGRKQIASLVGRDVSGDEKIADVFSLALQQKIVTVLRSEETTRHVSPTIVPVVLAVLLFFTLLPLGSLAVSLWVFIGFLLFRVALAFGWIKIERQSVEQEVLLP